MAKNDFVTIADLSRDEILHLIELASLFEKHPDRELLKGKIVATLFYEPSTRTRLSFETAANRLGGKVIGFSDAKASSVAKGETLKDTILMVSNYADIIVMRHFLEGAALYAAEVAPVPKIPTFIFHLKFIFYFYFIIFLSFFIYSNSLNIKLLKII